MLQPMEIEPSEELMRHNLSNPFGEADSRDFAELVSSMLNRGYDPAHPIVVYEGDILDGWHRYLAAKRSNVKPIFLEFVGSRAEAQAYVWAENMARRQMTARQKMAALILVNSGRGPDEQLSDAEIAVRVGLAGSGRLAGQLRQIGEINPALVHDVAVGRENPTKAIRTMLGEDPAGDEAGTSPDSRRPSVVWELKSKRLIERSHSARLRVGMAKQAWLNKAIELACEWAEGQPNRK